MLRGPVVGGVPGQIVRVTSTYFNASQQDLNGIDLDVNGKTKVGGGTAAPAKVVSAKLAAAAAKPQPSPAFPPLRTIDVALPFALQSDCAPLLSVLGSVTVTGDSGRWFGLRGRFLLDRTIRRDICRFRDR